MLIFRQLLDQDSSTYTYLLGDPLSKEALIIDSVNKQCGRDRALVRELGLRLLHILDTHCHADHVTGAWLLRHSTGAKIGISEKARVKGADTLLKHGDHIQFGQRYIEVRETPGHTDCCVTYVLDDESMAFTGDTLLIRGCGRTDFQQGDPRAMFRSVRTQILSLPDQTSLYPAHDYRGLTMTTVAEEKRHNPRLGDYVSEDDFVRYMNNLDLPKPEQIDVALPANCRCGRPAQELASEEDPTWAPLKLTLSGAHEVDASWLEENLGTVQVIDVRESDEFSGPLGQIPQAVNLPLENLVQASSDIKPYVPIVTVCRAGALSEQAAAVLKRAGFEQVAKLKGGMLNWRDRHLKGEVPQSDNS